MRETRRQSSSELGVEEEEEEGEEEERGRDEEEGEEEEEESTGPVGTIGRDEFNSRMFEGETGEEEEEETEPSCSLLFLSKDTGEYSLIEETKEPEEQRKGWRK